MSVPRKTPWLTEAAIEFLEGCVLTEAAVRTTVLEFGAGASSVWLAARCWQLTTIEHDKKWLDVATAGIRSNSWRKCLCELPYHSACDAFEDESLDLVLVDGRGRVECATSALRLIKPGGILMVDNTERRHYDPIREMCKTWNVTHATQRQPDSERFGYEGWSTTWWRKPNE